MSFIFLNFLEDVMFLLRQIEQPELSFQIAGTAALASSHGRPIRVKCAQPLQDAAGTGILSRERRTGRLLTGF